MIKFLSGKTRKEKRGSGKKENWQFGRGARTEDIITEGGLDWLHRTHKEVVTDLFIKLSFTEWEMLENRREWH